jgi:hypothetical protein
MANLLEILNDPNYVNANEATKEAIFNKYSAQDKNYSGANEATQEAIRNKFGIGAPVAAEAEILREPGLAEGEDMRLEDGEVAGQAFLFLDAVETARVVVDHGNLHLYEGFGAIQLALCVLLALGG